jgi:hypothetical protein
MVVGLMRLDLRIPSSGSLKEKRHVVKSLVAGLRSKFNVSVAESGHQALHQRAEVAVAIASGEGAQVRRVAHEIERYVDTFPAIEVIDAELTLHRPED